MRQILWTTVYHTRLSINGGIRGAELSNRVARFEINERHTKVVVGRNDSYGGRTWMNDKWKKGDSGR